MSSLSVHLRFPEDHSALPFHPSCPVCRRERLAGSLAGDELFSRRTRAAMAAGLLAFAGVGAPVAVASGPDQEVEGSAEVLEGGDSGAVDLGNGTTSLPDAEAQLPDDVDVDIDMSMSTDEADPPAAQAPVEDVAEPEMEASAEAAEPVVDPPEPAAEPEPEPVPQPVAVAAPPVEVPVATGVPESGNLVGPSVDDAEAAKRARPRVERVREPDERTAVAAPVGAPATTVGAGPVVPATAPMAPKEIAVRAPVAVRVVAGAGSNARGGEAAARERFHVVRRGESLWSIAADVLGERAGVGRIAREVNRLWALNEHRIASGNPDLLYAGTRLRLR